MINVHTAPRIPKHKKHQEKYAKAHYNQIAKNQWWRKRHIMQRGIKMTDFLSERIQVESRWTSLKYWNKVSVYKFIPVNLWIYTQQKIFLLSEDKIKTFSDIQTLKEFITSRPTLKPKFFRQKKNDAIWKYRARRTTQGKCPLEPDKRTGMRGDKGHRPPNRGTDAWGRGAETA